ncbi:MAG: cation:proton antiporter [Bacteroidales bacterium]|nr:cation:proton antiporter [Bacteroidales bacterium]
MEEINFVRDLAVILISAGIITIICRALKQPLILGYIIAGFLIGPNLGVFGISNQETVHLWSEIGMIFLMFGLGLEFSFKKLLKVGGSALVTAGSKFVGCFILGFVVGQAMGWTSMECIFLGGLLSMSSTMVVIKMFDEQGLKKKPFADVVFGTLVVEDLIAMILMVLLSTMAASNKFEGLGMLENIIKLVFFLTLWFVVGIYLIPSILKNARQYINDEILLIVSLGLCFAMVFLASSVGFSTALGAFVMGSILSETIEGAHIEKLLVPIKDLFGAIFFISVGMMIAPDVIAQYCGTILIITILVLVSHTLFSALGVALFGKGLDSAVRTGLSLTQLGEFGFILANVGVTLGVMRDFIYPVIIAVSVITIFISPYMLKLADPTLKLLHKILPERWKERLEPEHKVSTGAVVQSEWKKLLKSLVLRMFIYSVILLGIDLTSEYYLDPFMTKLFPDWSEGLHNVVFFTISLAVMIPFVYGLGISTNNTINESVKKLVNKNKNNTWPIFGIVILRSFLAVGFVMAYISRHFQLAGWVFVVLFVSAILMVIVARVSMRKFNKIEERFMANLNAKEQEKRRVSPVSTSITEMLGGYDVHIEEIVLSPDSEFVGKELIDLNFRQITGANVIKIIRGSQNIVIPSAHFVLYPYDKVLVVGTTSQIEAMRNLFSNSIHEATAPADATSFAVERVDIDEESLLVGKTLKELSLRKQGCMVVSMLRGEELITNPRPDERFAVGDSIWLAGDLQSINLSL